MCCNCLGLDHSALHALWCCNLHSAVYKAKCGHCVSLLRVRAHVLSCTEDARIDSSCLCEIKAKYLLFIVQFPRSLTARCNTMTFKIKPLVTSGHFVSLQLGQKAAIICSGSFLPRQSTLKPTYTEASQCHITTHTMYFETQNIPGPSES